MKLAKATANLTPALHPVRRIPKWQLLWQQSNITMLFY